MEGIIKAASQLTIGEIVGYFLAASGVICTVLEMIPKAVSPWTALFRAMGKAINGDVLRRLDEIELQVQENEGRDEERQIIAARIRIIRCGDEILQNVRHSKDYFDHILMDITTYEHYCARHPEFKNEITAMTIQHIKEIYKQCQQDRSFL